MRLGKDIVGKQIITLSDGRLLGKVKDIYIDRDLSAMTGVHLGREGLFRRKENLIACENVVLFGLDAILIKNENSVSDNQQTDITGWMRLGELAGRSVDTPGGTKLAVIGDVILDTEGQITGFALAKINVAGPIAQTRTFGREVVIDNGHEDGVMTIDLTRAEQQAMATATEETAEDDAPPAPEEEKGGIEEKEETETP